MNIFSFLHRSHLRRVVRMTAALLCAIISLAGHRAQAQAVEGISASALQQIQALQLEKRSRTPAQRKMDSQLVYALKQSLGQAIAPGVTNLRTAVQTAPDGRVWLDLDATVTPDLLSFIANSGGTVLNSFPQFRSIRALVPIGLAETLAGRSEVKFVRAAVPAVVNTGSVTSEGDVTHLAGTARQTFGVDGSGVRVGVLSDSVDYLSNSQATGDLPSDVIVLPGQSGVPASGEGTAMLEIVYDLAPGAKLYYATAFNGQASFAQNILNLRAAGCDVIIDDVGYANESPFQDGIIAQAVNTVTADGALYFSSAGNSGSVRHGTSGTWQGDFADGGAIGTPITGGGNLHSFGATPYDTLTSGGFWTTLFWADPLGGSTNDYDLYLLDAAGATVVGSSTTLQNGSQDPFEFIAAPAAGERIVIVKVSGDARFLHLDTGRGQLTINTSGNTKGHSAATNAFSVAAVDVATAYPNPFTGGPANPVETFSSDGPRQVFFNVDGTPITPGDFSATGGFVRQKPDISAADGVVTTLPPNSGLNPFFGTSAAAPHAGAIAALLKSYNSSLSTRAIRNLLTGTALDIEAVGVDENSGAGIVMALQALQASPPPAPLPRFVISTNLLSGGNGNGVIDFNECNDLFLVVSNLGFGAASHLQVTLSTPTPGVAFGVRNSPYPDLGVGVGGTNLIAFTMSTAPTFVCGTPVVLNVLFKCDEVTTTTTLVLSSGGAGIPVRFDNPNPVAIRDNDPLGTNSVITVSKIAGAIDKVTVALYLTHTFVSDLYFELIGPDGTTVMLSAHNGGSGNNYGTSCSPDLFRTTFDDSSPSPISGGVAPFVGTFKPQQPLSAFVGKSGSNVVNGDWRLHLVDNVGLDVGTLQCWSLFVSSATCTDGGGTCPGADLAIGMTDAPDPVFIGSNLVYTISVTNFGPSAASNVVANQFLPPSVVFVSAVASQGSVTHSGGTVVGNIGTLPLMGVATLNVTVIPTIAAVITSTATVSSEQPDPDTANNTVTITSRVNPPASDLAVSILDSPDPVLLGETLTYNVTLINNGPSTASGVTVTNTLPVSEVVQSASSSQGTVTINGNLVIFNFGTLTNAGRATGTIAVTPVAEGTIVATAVARANQVDPQPANNIAVVSTAVGPAADVAVTMTSIPSSVVVRSNWTYSIAVTNIGPSSASGTVVNQTLPVGVNVVSTSTTSGTVSVAGNAVTAKLGTLARGFGAVVTIKVNATTIGSYVSTVTTTAAQADPHVENNTAQVSTLVASPFVSIAPAGATVTAESQSPADGGVSSGETVTVQLRLRNAGNVSNTNLTAILLATGGVTSPAPVGPVVYGMLAPGGLPVAQAFTFTASGTNGGTVVATLQLQDNGVNLTNVTFTFPLPTVQTFANPAAISIPDSGSATPYPSTIEVSGVTGLVGKITATLSNFTHTFPQDVDVLLVAPGGQKIMLMSGAGAPVASSVDITFDDAAAFAIPQNSTIASGSYRPASYTPAHDLLGPAPANPYETTMSIFNGGDPNGEWSLYVFDRAAGDAGNIAGGWSLAVTLVSPVNQVADLGVTALVQPNPTKVAENINCIFTITNTGPNAATGVSFTNLVPAGAVLVSATSSQGILTTNSAAVFGSLGTINVGGAATVNLVVRPTAAGGLVLSGAAGSSETDLNPANNTGSAVTTVTTPVADLAVAAVASTNAIVVGSNLTFTVSVTNDGPQQAVGVWITYPLPAGVSFVGTTAGGYTNSAGTIQVNLGDLPAGAHSTFDLVANASAIGTLTNVISGATASSDTNAANDSVVMTVVVSAPAPIIAPASALLTAESFTPPNATVDAGETVKVSLSLKNIGLVNTTNLVATLQDSGGVNSPSGAQNYGALLTGGATVTRSYTFTASGTNGGVVVATLQLQDGANNLGTTAFTFSLPGTTSFTNSAAITIPSQGSASPYPSIITVSGMTGLTAKAVVTLAGLTHSFPDDVDVLLVSPTGQKVVLMSDVGGGHAITNLTLTFDDAGPLLPDSSTLFSGTFAPTDFEPGDYFPPPAPVGTPGATLATFNSTNPNGDWLLFVADDSPGDSGSIASGWTLTLTAINAVNPLTDLAVTLGGSPASLFVGSGLTYNIVVVNHGPAAATGVTVQDVLPPGVNFISATTTQGSFNNSAGVVTFNFGSLPVTGVASASVRVSPSFGGNLVNSVTVTGVESDLSLANNTAQMTTTIITPVRANLTDITVTNAHVQFTLVGDAGMAYVIQASTNLTTWTSLATNTAAANGTIKFSDAGSPGFSSRFYRAIRVIP